MKQLSKLALLGALLAASVGAPHKRDRYWFVADAVSSELRVEPGRRSGASGSGAPFAREHGETRTFPNTGGEQYQVEKEIGKTSQDLNANETIWSFLVTKKLAAKNTSNNIQ